ncbi:HET-domain-containing protein [Ganoderma leucocontextum]|nr:HET-domain-containing protein [Ganoderma leucocontextum]
MRLLDLITGDFVEFTNGPSTTPPYAILSHRWANEEQTYQDIRGVQNSCKPNSRSAAASPPHLPPSSSHDPTSTVLASSPTPPQSIWDSDSGLTEKVRGACEAARKDGFRYLWIDSCCIDKTSSSELSESINSMFAWYRDAAVCYTFLADVPTVPSASLRSEGSAFRSSEWFTRGWTLQELIAPCRLVFLSQTWEPLGTKASLALLVEEITGIPVSVLTGRGRGPHKSLDECSVAQRMSWAAKRQTTKVEDQAYSLLGIFDIQMSTLYGEGERAFRRLQEEILRRIPDQSIFAWGPIYPESFPSPADSPDPANELKDAMMASAALPNESRRCYIFTTSGTFPILAHSPRDFVGAGKVVPVPHSTFFDLLTRYWPISPQEYTSTPHGIRTDFPLLPLASCLTPEEAFFEVKDAQRARWYLAVLACEQSDFPGQLLCRICHVAAPERPVNVLHRGFLCLPGRVGEFGFDAHFGIVRLAPYNEPWLVKLRVHTVFLDHPSRSLPTSIRQRIQDARSDEAITFMLPTWCRDALDVQGYAASLEGAPSDVGGGLHRLVLSPQPRTNSDSDLYRWSITADFSYQWTQDADGLRIHAAVHIAGQDSLGYTKHLEWLHVNPSWPSLGWHCRLMSERLELVSEKHETLTLELGVQLASASCYHIHADIISELPAE